MSERKSDDEPHGDYLILYHVLNDTIEVLHIIHGARDYKRLLGPKTIPPSDARSPACTAAPSAHMMPSTGALPRRR